MFYSAPCMVLVLSEGSEWSAIDCGILCQNITLAAHSIGLGSCIVGMARVPIGGPRGEEFKKHLKFPEGFELCIGVLVGTPNKGKEPHEHDISKVTFI